MTTAVILPCPPNRKIKSLQIENKNNSQAKDIFIQFYYEFRLDTLNCNRCSSLDAVTQSYWIKEMSAIHDKYGNWWVACIGGFPMCIGPWHWPWCVCVCQLHLSRTHSKHILTWLSLWCEWNKFQTCRLFQVSKGTTPDCTVVWRVYLSTDCQYKIKPFPVA